MKIKKLREEIFMPGEITALAEKIIPSQEDFDKIYVISKNINSTESTKAESAQEDLSNILSGQFGALSLLKYLVVVLSLTNISEIQTKFLDFLKKGGFTKEEFQEIRKIVVDHKEELLQKAKNCKNADPQQGAQQNALKLTSSKFVYTDSTFKTSIPKGVTELIVDISNSPISKDLNKQIIKSGNSDLSLVFSDQVKSIEAFAFQANDQIKSVHIGARIHKINPSTFSSCKNLSQINLGDNLLTIGDRAFAACEKLTDLEIPVCTKYIGISAFKDCIQLTSVVLRDNLIDIGDYAFENCKKLKDIELSNSVKTIGENAFMNSGIKWAVIGNNVTSIGEKAFACCNELTSIILPNSINSIGESTFFECGNLKSIEIPNSVTSIGGWAFYTCSGLTSIEIPNSVTSIGDSAFSGCSGLTSVTIGSGVTSIGYEAFSGCSGLTSIEIPSSVTSIRDWAFEYCDNLVKVDILNKNIKVSKRAFVGCSPKLEIKGLNESLAEDLEKHKALNPKLWTKDNKLKKEVTEKINEIVDTFVENLKEDEVMISVKDIILIGSNASYNYTKDSDLDIHIITSTARIKSSDRSLYAKLYSAYRTIFNKKFDIDFYNIPVEIFVETENTTTVSNGIYSVKNNKWIKEPSLVAIPDYDKKAVKKLFDKYEDRYNSLMEEDKEELNPDLIDKLIQDVYAERKEGISTEGEYSTGNLVFKEFRNKGYLDKLKDFRNEVISIQLSLSENWLDD